MRASRPQVLAAASAVEAAAAAVAVLLDLVVPSLVLVVMAGVSLLLRRERPSSLGLHGRPGWGLAGTTFLLAVAWTVFQLSVTLPVANHVSGSRQDLSAFEDLEGDLRMLALLLVAGWVLGAVVEEVAYRGYLLTRVQEALGGGRAATVAAVVVSSVLFGVAHSEQGWIGVLAVTVDGVWFAALRLYFGTLWASVLAHGFNNTIGFVAFFLVGPVYAFW